MFLLNRSTAPFYVKKFCNTNQHWGFLHWEHNVHSCSTDPSRAHCRVPFHHRCVSRDRFTDILWCCTTSHKHQPCFVRARKGHWNNTRGFSVQHSHSHPSTMYLSANFFFHWQRPPWLWFEGEITTACKCFLTEVTFAPSALLIQEVPWITFTRLTAVPFIHSHAKCIFHGITLSAYFVWGSARMLLHPEDGNRLKTLYAENSNVLLNMCKVATGYAF